MAVNLKQTNLVHALSKIKWVRSRKLMCTLNLYIYAHKYCRMHAVSHQCDKHYVHTHDTNEWTPKWCQKRKKLWIRMHTQTLAHTDTINCVEQDDIPQVVYETSEHWIFDRDDVNLLQMIETDFRMFFFEIKTKSKMQNLFQILR